METLEKALTLLLDGQVIQASEPTTAVYCICKDPKDLLVTLFAGLIDFFKEYAHEVVQVRLSDAHPVVY
jgi:hypothetical protein